MMISDCVIGFFLHIDKTGGTSLRSFLKNQAIMGNFDIISFTRMQTDNLWAILLQNLVLRSQMNHSLRLLVEIHTGPTVHPQTFLEQIPDILALRKLYEPKCHVKLFTILREPLNQIISLHNYAIRGQVPLCVWNPTPNPQLRLLFGYTYGAAMHRKTLNDADLSIMSNTLREHFDVVGRLDSWWESVSRIADILGISRASVAIKNMNVARPPSQRISMLNLIQKRMKKSSRNANILGRNMLQCQEYGCILHGRNIYKRTTWIDSMCTVDASVVLERLRNATKLDEKLYDQFIIKNSRHAWKLKRLVLKKNITTKHSSTCPACTQNDNSIVDSCWQSYDLIYEENKSYPVCTRTWYPTLPLRIQHINNIRGHAYCWQTCWTETSSTWCSPTCNDIIPHMKMEFYKDWKIYRDQLLSTLS